MEAVTSVAGRRRVQKIDPMRVAALLNQDRVPALPHRVVALRRYVADRAPDNTLSKIAWFITGDPFNPSGIMGLEPRFDTLYGRWVLEILELRGSAYDMRALIYHARDMAKANGWVLTGELDAENLEMRVFVNALFKKRERPDRVRFSWEF